jgi:hypothetical protein
MRESVDDLDSFLPLPTSSCYQPTVATSRQKCRNFFNASHQNQSLQCESISITDLSSLLYFRPIRETLQAIKDWTESKAITDIEFRDNLKAVEELASATFQH